MGSGILSAAEIAVSSANRTKVKMRAESGDKKAAKLLKALESPSNIFATTQFYITFVAFFSGAYAAESFTDPILEWLGHIGFPISEGVAEPLVFIFITATLTYFTLIFGELVPKRIALQNAVTFARLTIGPLNVLSAIALPFVKTLSFSANSILKLIGIRAELLGDDVSKEEIQMMVESGSEHGNIGESEHDMIINIFEFNSKTAEDACIHRMEVVALPIDASFQDVVAVLTNEAYTRIPIYEESIDNILGVLHMKDVMQYMVDGKDTKNFDIRTLLREPYFVPFSKKTDELFQAMQKKRVHMAVVLDEYGGTLGIVTMEDLVEEIMGSILDEYDTDEQPDIEELGENRYSIRGSADLEEVGDYFGVDLPIDEYDTLSGFFVGQLGHILTEDEKPELAYGGLLFKVESVQEKRIAKVIVSRIEKAGESDE